MFPGERERWQPNRQEISPEAVALLRDRFSKEEYCDHELPPAQRLVHFLMLCGVAVSEEPGFHWRIKTEAQKKIWPATHILMKVPTEFDPGINALRAVSSASKGQLVDFKAFAKEQFLGRKQKKETLAMFRELGVQIAEVVNSSEPEDLPFVARKIVEGLYVDASLAPFVLMSEVGQRQGKIIDAVWKYTQYRFGGGGQAEVGANKTKILGPEWKEEYDRWLGVAIPHACRLMDDFGIKGVSGDQLLLDFLEKTQIDDNIQGFDVELVTNTELPLSDEMKKLFDFMHEGQMVHFSRVNIQIKHALGAIADELREELKGQRSVLSDILFGLEMIFRYDNERASFMDAIVALWDIPEERRFMRQLIADWKKQQNASSTY